MTNRLERGGVIALAFGHFALGLALLPDAMFTKYPDGARLLWAGTLKAEEGADFSPLYLLVNAAVGASALRWLQSALGAGCVALVYVVARRLFSRAAGFVAAALFALSAPVLLYEATLEPDLLVTALNLLAIALLVTRRPAWAAGLALGLSIAARPTAIPFLLLAVAWVYAAEHRWRAPLVLGATALLLSFVPPLILRAAVGQQLGGTMSVGPVFQQSNRPEGTGLGAQPPVLIKLVELQVRSRDNPDPVHGLYRRFARAEGGAALTPPEVQRFWLGKTLSFATHEPGAYAQLLFRKLCFFVFGPDGHDIQEVRLAAAQLGRWPLLPTAWLGLVGTIALGLHLAGRKQIGLLAAYALTTTGLALGFYVVSRFRLATVPIWCVLAAGLVVLAQEWKAKPRKLALGGLAAAAALLFARLAEPVRTGERMIARGAAAAEPAAQMDAARRSGNLTPATQAFVRAQAAQPYVTLTRDLRGIAFEDAELARASGRAALETFGEDTPTDVFFAAVLAGRAGRCREALPSLQHAAGFRSAIFDVSLDPNLFAATCALEQGAKDEARQAIARSLAGWPGTLDGLALATAGGADTKAELFALHDLLSARYALAKARLLFGDAAGALEDADAALALIPEAGVVHYERARALALLGRSDEAAAAYARALELFPAYAFPTRPFDAVIAARLQAAPEDPGVLALASEHHLRAGDVAGAKALAEQAAQRWGDAAPEPHRARLRFLREAR